jgi:dihydrofolate reductase
MKKFNVIVACSSIEGGIGNQGKLPWRLPADMNHFAKTTRSSSPGLSNAVIMGKSTWESLRGPLPGRFNIVVSGSLLPAQCNAHAIASSLDDALSCAELNQAVDSVFVIGGSRLYTEALEHPRLDKVFLTLVDSGKKQTYDAFFPVDRVLTSMQVCETGRVYEECGALCRFMECTPSTNSCHQSIA